MDHGGSERLGMLVSDKDVGQVKLRLPLPLKDWLAGQAQGNRRSLSSEMVLRLEESREQQLAAQQPATLEESPKQP